MELRARHRLLLAAAAVLLAALAWLAVQRAGPGARPPDPAPVADAASRRGLPAGEVVGFVGRYGSHVWLGLPFARPPVGELRWRPAEPAPRFAGLREALAFGPHCPQLASPFGGVDGPPGTLTGSEDCLYLNVYAPRFEPRAVPVGDARLPVMVWIYGGGNVIGLADNYDGGNLAARENLVVVTVNYRIGPLGWFRHAALREGEGEDAASGNFGTLDLVRALAWVRENVAVFGGDPGNVTIFGESAGARNVYSLLLAPRAKGLFQRAIAQSGGLYFEPPARAENWSDDPEAGRHNSSNEVIARLLAAEGRAASREAARELVARTPAAELARWLRSKSVAELFARYDRDPEEGLLDVPRLFADGSVLPSGGLLERLGRAGGWNSVPVMAGTNRDEQKLFMFASPIHVRRWLGVIPRVREPDLYLATAEAVSLLWKANGADAPAAAMRRVQPNVFVYRFDWDEEPRVLGFDVGRFVGAAHGFEIPFVFGHFVLGSATNRLFTGENRAGRETLSAWTTSYWAQFAYAGSPGRGRRGELPEWTAWDPASGAHKYAILDTPAGGGVRMGSDPVSEEEVFAAALSDARLRTPRERCFVLHELVPRAARFSFEDYAAACPDHPFDAFPWR